MPALPAEQADGLIATGASARMADAVPPRFRDTNAHGQGHKPQHVYGVRFAARDLWGEQAAARDREHR